MPDAPITDGSAIDAEIAGIEDTMRTDGRAYWSDPALQERYGALLRSKESGAASLPAPVTVSRRTEIEALMRRDGGRAYWRGPNADRLQAEYRELLEIEAAAGARSPAAPDAAPVGRGDASAAPAARAPAGDIEMHGLDKEAFEVGQHIAGELDMAFGADAQETNNVISGLDDALQAAMAHELASPYVPRGPNASSAETRQFAGTSHGRLLADKWGSDAPRRLAIAMARVARFEAGLDDVQHKEWQHFWDHGLSAAERAALLETLTR